MRLDLISVVVAEYDEAIAFYTEVLGFELTEDAATLTNDGRPKRWVVLRPPGGGTGLLLARADSPTQEAVVGNQFAGRVGLFLRVDDFDAHLRRMLDAGVQFVGDPRTEPYGRVAVFVDIAGNRWDLLSGS
ncbi:MAG: VOC family protein [Nakamurella sp.]